VNPTYRSARREELPLAADIFLTSLAELAQNNGLARPVGYTRESVLPLYEHLFDTGMFEVAEVSGEVVGIAAGIVRDEIFFLSMFWVLPAHKLQGIGRPLLERVQRLAEAQGATKRCTWSSIDLPAVATYLKLGLMPAGPIFTFAGPAPRDASAALGAQLTALDENHASAIDHIVRGTPRPADHAFWKSRQVPGFQLEIEGRTVGYFYAQNGVIGPAAWLRAEDGALLLANAMAVAGSQAKEIKLIALGLNQTAIRAASAARLRLISASHLLLTESFGKLEQYLPSGPGLF
jgi:GNAT superfamily N-acetyltransferase